MTSHRARRSAVAVAVAVAGILLALTAAAWAPGAGAETVTARELRERAEAAADGDTGGLAEVTAVRVGDGRVPLDGRRLVKGGGAAERARQLVAALDAREDAAPVDAARARRQAVAILGRPKGPHKPNWLERLLERIGNAISGFFKDLGISVPGGALGAVLALVAVAALTLLVVAVVRTRRRLREESAGDDGTAPGKPRKAKDWEAEARRAAQEGRYEDALRFRHFAGLLRLDDGGWIRFTAGRTDGEYATDLSGRLPGAARDFRSLSRLVQDVVFGSAPADAGTLARSEEGWRAFDAGLAPEPEDAPAAETAGTGVGR